MLVTFATLAPGNARRDKTLNDELIEIYVFENHRLILARVRRQKKGPAIPAKRFLFSPNFSFSKTLKPLNILPTGDGVIRADDVQLGLVKVLAGPVVLVVIASELREAVGQVGQGEVALGGVT